MPFYGKYVNMLILWKYCVYVYLYIADSSFPLYIIEHHKFSQHAIGGNFGLLDDVGSEGDLAEGFVLFD